MPITVTPFPASPGAEVSGVDLSKPLDQNTKAALTDALAEHLALVFHDQSLTPEQYLAAAEVFGPPMRQHYGQHNMEDHPDIGLIWHRNGQQPAERWHTDHTNREKPPAATILYGVEIPSHGGGTSVADMRAAYAALPETEQARLRSLRTVNRLDAHAPGRCARRGQREIRSAGGASDGADPSRAWHAGGLFPHHQDGLHRGDVSRRQPAYLSGLLDRMITGRRSSIRISGAAATCWSSTIARQCTGHTATMTEMKAVFFRASSSRATGRC